LQAEIEIRPHGGVACDGPSATVTSRAAAFGRALVVELADG
jgi:hypothetical protein